MKLKIFSAVFFLILTSIILTCSSCQRREERRVYDEIVLDSPLKSMQAMPPDHQQFLQAGMGSLPPMMPSGESRDTAGVMASVKNDTPLKWSTPQGWTERKGSGMRLVTFLSEAAEDQVECSIVSLGGSAGGIKANIVRWLGQVHIPVPSDEDLEQFLAKQEDFESRGQLKGKLLDFTQLQENTPAAAPSLMAAIIETDGAQIFVKMTGTKSALNENKSSFTDLCLSLEMKE